MPARCGASVKNAIKAIDQLHGERVGFTAAFELGQMLDPGANLVNRGVPNDQVRAAEVYKLAADSSDVTAGFYVWQMYADGRGVAEASASV